MIRTLTLIAWGITRIVGVALFSLTEPVLQANVWLAKRLKA